MICQHETDASPIVVEQLLMEWDDLTRKNPPQRCEVRDAHKARMADSLVPVCEVGNSAMDGCEQQPHTYLVIFAIRDVTIAVRTRSRLARRGPSAEVGLRFHSNCRDWKASADD